MTKKKKFRKAELSLRKKIFLIAIPLVALRFALCVLHLFLADVSFNNGEGAKRYGFFEQAAEDYRAAIALNPREPRYHRELAYVLARLGEVEAAAREAEIAYNLNPKNSLTIRSLVSTYIELSDFDPQYQIRAEELIAEAIVQQPTNPQLYYEQALILLRAKKNKEAITSLKKAVELKPDYQKARELLETFLHN